MIALQQEHLQKQKDRTRYREQLSTKISLFYRVHQGGADESGNLFLGEIIYNVEDMKSSGFNEM